MQLKITHRNVMIIVIVTTNNQVHKQHNSGRTPTVTKTKNTERSFTLHDTILKY